MEDEERSLRHKLKKVEQEKRALKGLIERVADEIEELPEADCSEEAIGSAKAQAKRLRRASSSAPDQQQLIICFVTAMPSWQSARDGQLTISLRTGSGDPGARSQA